MAARRGDKTPPEPGWAALFQQTRTGEGKTHLELPVGRLEELLGLVRGASSRQNKLVDHHLVPEFLHIYGHRRFLLDARTSRGSKTKVK